MEKKLFQTYKIRVEIIPSENKSKFWEVPDSAFVLIYFN